MFDDLRLEVDADSGGIGGDKLLVREPGDERSLADPSITNDEYLGQMIGIFAVIGSTSLTIPFASHLL